jgi:hypothetical protein
MFQKGLYNFESLYEFINKTCTVFCTAMTFKKYTKIYMRYLQFKITSTGNTACLKKSFTIVFQMLPCGECYENVYN